MNDSRSIASRSSVMTSHLLEEWSIQMKNATLRSTSQENYNDLILSVVTQLFRTMLSTRSGPIWRQQIS